MTRVTLFATTMALASVATTLMPAKAAELTTLYKFTSTIRTEGVEGTMVAIDNVLYGATEEGGNGPENDGTIFKFDLASKTETTLVNFTGTSGPHPGQGPSGPLLAVGKSIYGATVVGGIPDNLHSFGNGEIWKLNSVSGKEQVFHGFDDKDGALPYEGVIRAKGAFYGTTGDGGPNGTGTVYKLDARGKLTELYTFPDSTIGCLPTTGVVVVGKLLYGTTAECGANGGSVFSLNLSTSVATALHFFPPNNSGVNDPQGLIFQNGALYGTTFGDNGAGTFYKIDLKTHQYSVLHQFGGKGDGVNPVATLTPFNGLIYGVTQGGGASGNGTIYSLDPATGNEAVVYSFTGGKDGDSPDAGLLAYNGVLYGSTLNTNSDQQGTIFVLTP